MKLVIVVGEWENIRSKQSSSPRKGDVKRKDKNSNQPVTAEDYKDDHPSREDYTNNSPPYTSDNGASGYIYLKGTAHQPRLLGEKKQGEFTTLEDISSGSNSNSNNNSDDNDDNYTIGGLLLTFKY
ncbi:hypothetical protein K469DRAFT_692409 [Zopfia rhizophila CBS 207.26]|uniref:Uncharacterized protein n=1 Tax=Zopfia rhizophila CBS 207.26 TaxID=1314779 RepID=A0A6A6DMY2_9PEZI|nr:hypothetical protein K469DRAFT_692409 [Zopfia rhizophila CBS 207.26]